MQKNSTSIIVRRTALVVAFGLITHLFARLVWHFQVFGMNTVLVNCRTEEGETTYGNWTTQWSYPVCDEARGTDFLAYTPLSNTWPILGTHLLGLFATSIIFALVYWIVYRKQSGYATCTNKHCACNSHHRPQQYIEGQWEYADCTDPDCPCVEHKGEVFDATLGKWVAP